MARLRKPDGSVELHIVLPATTAKTTRSSPRKPAPESPSRRELRYTSSYEQEDSFLVPKVPASLTIGDSPKKQRVLRPVASNSRLLRKLSNESLATPERRERRANGEMGLGYLYSKSLAKTVAKSKGILGKDMMKIEVQLKETVLDENEEPDQSLWCADEEDQNPQLRDGDEFENESEDDDEDPVIDLRHRKRQPQTRPIIQDSDTEEEKERKPNLETERETQFPAARLERTSQMPPPRPPFRKGHSIISNWAQEVIDLTSSPEPPASFVLPPPTSSRPTSSTSNVSAANLHYSPTPTKLRSPRKAPPISRPNTPPLPSASPSKLVSPSKKKNHIPHAPDLRASLDAFWAADVVNDWNDKHSPSKPLLSPRKQKWLRSLEKHYDGESSSSDASFVSPTTSPRKGSTQSPKKKSSSSSISPTVAQVRAQRKAFSTAKHDLASSFLAELDMTITSGKIATLTSPTGGIKIIWSKTLKTTAGRANWRREQIRLRIGPSPTDIRTEIRHHCSIELAEKVIDDEERLYNVLAHEYCHLTTFMISNVRNNPHGAEFKSWASQASASFAHKGVHVTTKHSYQIAYKYVWECIACGYEFKRHSKSVDPERHSCGRCKGRLVQTKPVPRGAAGAAAGAGKCKAGAQPREKSEYQVFVKANFGKVKKRLEEEGKDAQMGKVMEAVAKEYREMKESRKAEENVGDGLGDVELALGGLNLGGD